MNIKYLSVILGSLLFVTLGIIANRLYQDSSGSQTTAGDVVKYSDNQSSSSYEMESLRGDISLLRDQVALLQKQLQAVDKEANPAAQSNDKAKQEISEEERRKAAQLAAEKQISLLENQLATEDEDAAWSANAKSRIYDAFGAATMATANASILGVDCRTSLCKVEVAAGNANSEDIRKSLIPQIGDIMPQGVMQTVDQGGVHEKLVFYMGRDGYKLPAESNVE